MSTDSSVTKKLVETLEDAKNGYAKGAQALAGSNEPQLSSTFAKYAHSERPSNTAPAVAGLSPLAGWHPHLA
jgi:hypothetical protein